MTFGFIGACVCTRHHSSGQLLLTFEMEGDTLLFGMCSAPRRVGVEQEGEELYEEDDQGDACAHDLRCTKYWFD